MMKERMKLSLPPEVKKYIQSYMKEHHLSFTGDAISRICQEHEEAQKRKDDSIKKIVKNVTQNIEDLFQRERLHIKKELLYMEQNIERSTRNSLKEVEDYSIAKRGELFASLLEGYEK
ncbi:hypothetical protein P4661_30305 [Priestia megaterium]|uniref:hypothetical protein n=1 Tax=Priestia megaterium TaxID=1404 RepID=UPI002453071D|nr:hypothetical protein [Priestia megaterium]MDH3161326.1 hypothetical protein [Priestia megaterium]MED4117128.1 hypothetical protein [Priestia megaterium]